MIRPVIRASIQWHELEAVVAEVKKASIHESRAIMEELQVSTPDDFLRHPYVIKNILFPRHLSATKVPLHLFLLIAVNHSLEEIEIQDLDLADYLASLLLSFSSVDVGHNSTSIYRDTQYITDLFILAESSPESAPLIRSYIAEFSLWMAGIWRNRIEYKRQTKGAPDISYYENVGRALYDQLASAPAVQSAGLSSIYYNLSLDFTPVRIALNDLATQYFFPTTSEKSVEYLLERAQDLFRPL